MRLREANLKGFSLSHGGEKKKGLKRYKAKPKTVFISNFSNGPLDLLTFNTPFLHDKEVMCKLIG